MKVSLIFLFYVFIITESPKNKNLIKLDSPNKTTTIKQLPSIKSRDTLYIKDVAKGAKGDFDWSKNMPWIGAILVGITTVVANYIISKQNRIVSRDQINSASSTALAQITLAKENNIRDFNKTVVAANGQLWINEFRTIISEILTIVEDFSLKHNLSSEDNRRLQFLIIKIELMLSTDVAHIDFRDLLMDFKQCFKNVQMQTKDFDELASFVIKIKEDTNQILYAEWEKVRKP